VRKFLFLMAALVFLLSSVTGADEPIPLSRYLEFARACADWTWNNYDDLVAQWRKTLDPENVFGYRAPPRLLEMAAIYATLYEMEKNEDHAARARRVLLTYGDFREAYPEEAAKRRADYAGGVPALPDFFTTMRYIRAYDSLKRLGFLTAEERTRIEAIAAESLDYLLRTQEWGAMNRAALRAETLAWAVRAIPDHPKARYWSMYEDALRADNWGQWEIEDATIYHAVWLYALLGYADAKGEMKELFRTPEMFYYAQYFLHLMCPDDMIPDFGDARWRDNWSRYLVFFEAAAAAYKDPQMKWAAQRIGRKFLDLTNEKNIGLAYLLLDAFRFGTDDLTPETPKELSEEVMEDVQGKKIVFRNGWRPDSTYMLLNYRDEGDGGLLFRDYLRDTIPVEEEKMTHGHADENSIVLLMAEGSLLLHDGGYRDYMPSGPYGAYRQDYFHNRLCVRQEKIWMGQKEGEYRYAVEGNVAVAGQPVLDFLHNAGSYRIVRTQKVDFLTFSDFDYSRTRLIDDRLGYQWDRVITYIKDPGLFVVFDIMKATVEEFFTACNLWHTRKIVARGDHWYDTVYDRMRSQELNTGTNLWIHFPYTHYKLESVEPEQRHYQDEWMIAQYTGQHFELGQHIGFVTVLVPHEADSDPTEWLDRIRFVESQPERTGMAVEIRAGDRIINVGVKRDLRMDMTRDWRRPKYTWESGRIDYGDLATNADFFYTERKGNRLAYTVVNLTKAFYQGRVLFEQLPSFFGLAYDGAPENAGIGKARYWRDEVEL
jgi:hypothetical protein